MRPALVFGAAGTLPPMICGPSWDLRLGHIAVDVDEMARNWCFGLETMGTKTSFPRVQTI